MRILHRLYAAIFGYFWLPCPVCGKKFGGHEWDFGTEALAVEEADGWHAYGVCSDSCSLKAAQINDANGMTPPTRMRAASALTKEP